MKVKRYFLEVHDPGIGIVHTIAEYFIPEFGLFINKEATFSYRGQDADNRVACGKSQKEFEITDSAVISLVAELGRRVDMRQASEERVKELVATIRKESSLSDFETQKVLVFRKEGMQDAKLWVDILSGRVFGTTGVVDNYQGALHKRASKLIKQLKRDGYTEVTEL